MRKLGQRERNVVAMQFLKLNDKIEHNKEIFLRDDYWYLS